MSSKLINVGLSLIYIILFAAGVTYEAPTPARMLQLIAVAALSGMVLWLPAVRKGQTLLLGLGIILLGVLEANSKFSVNYLFHLMYYVLLLGAYRRVDFKIFSGLAGVMLLTSTYKYLYLLSGSVGAVDLGEAGVITTVSCLVVTILLLAIGLRQERNDIQGLNLKLNEAMEALEGLTLLKERNRVSREIHDTLGHELTALIMKMELSKHWHSTDDTQSQLYLQEAIDEGRKALKSVRHVVSALKAPKRSNEDLVLLLNRFRQTSPIAIAFEATLDLADLPDEEAHMIYRVVQEGVTNIIRHSQATMARVGLTRESANVLLTIEDNGKATGTIVEGFGLSAMRDRVAELGGVMTISHADGFRIKIEIPDEGDKER